MDPFILSILGIAVLAAVLLGLVSLVFFLIRTYRNRKDQDL